MSEMDAYKEVFLAESAEFLQRIVDALLALEATPHDLAPVEEVFRGAHSLKGMAAAMGYERTAELTHRMESLMERVRKRELPVSSEVVDLMLAAVDLVKTLIDEEASGTGATDASEMIAAIERMAEGARAGQRPAGERTGPPSADRAGAFWRVTVTLDESCVLKAVRAYMVLKRLAYMGSVLETHPPAQDIEDERFELSFEAVLQTAAGPEEIRDAVLQVSEVADVAVEPYEPPAAGTVLPEGAPVMSAPLRTRELPKLSQTQTVRVSIGHLDALVNLVGELVILRSRLERIAEEQGVSELTEAIGELERISTEMQYEVMQTRMVPVGNIFNRFPRMVRDLATELGKQIDFSMEGLDIELDRTVLDEIGDPLVHLLRNCIDHGIEPAEERVRAGKPAAGTITLRAVRERDHVAIVVSDDGRGIDVERVWRKAVERGLVADADRADYDDGDILLFTCIPGFTTAETATKISGRGVGMDVVKGKIEHLGGTLQIRSEPGHGTDFILRLPLTLAIIQALVVECRGQRFALPLSAVDEVFSADDVALDTLDGYPVVVLRDGGLVPLVRLDALLFDADPRAPIPSGSNIVLVNPGPSRRALMVDGLGGRKEIVVKPLTGLLRDEQFSGATVLGDGSVMLILDPRALARTEVCE